MREGISSDNPKTKITHGRLAAVDSWLGFNKIKNARPIHLSGIAMQR